MDFTQTETRRMLADTIERYLRDQYPLMPRVEAGNSETGYQQAHYDGLAELGVMAALFSEDQGGFGGDGFDIAVVFEEMGKRLVNEPVMDNALIPGAILAAAGKTDQVEEIIGGAARYALAAEEPHALYDLAEVDTTAQLSENAWRLNGSKTVVKYANGCDGFIVSARTDAGIGLYMVNAGDASLRSYTTTDGGRASELTLDNTPSTLIAENGADLLAEAQARAIVALSAEALGIMLTIREMTIEYLRTRKQFGLPIGKFQALQHRMAEMLVEIEQARSAVINAANVMTTPGAARDRIMAATKYSIGRIGRLVSEESIQMHGGIGMTWEYDLGHYAKRLIMIDHEWGDQDFHLARFIELGQAA
ncbi:acyl-CoA dehydrogenase family protein [Alisedimentitalea sp. MJ-SS2]|uniref:acyl-CoA dehydrogenase family protein n=1 Tax=Aliisedimentitalea sp. MJ-SS2 TaxID=3049795 RepID=UPI00290692CE|nr:acyl-CoA dehydrogenase family protein [Alisedimentitalea sp. MJ-SS2]MDU8927538.1 acyl-CoA dehydrogenase family protein [Alisedimentitalea sp. MJ-SS2]